MMYVDPEFILRLYLAFAIAGTLVMIRHYLRRGGL